MIKAIRYEATEIIIEEEKKGLFGKKNKTTTINSKSITEIERVIENGELKSVNIHYNDYDIFFIEEYNIEGNISIIFEKIMEYRKETLFEIYETDFTSGNPEFTVILEKGK